MAKFSSYKVIITKEDQTKELKSATYKEMMNVYREVKEKETQANKIEFVGITLEGVEEIQFTKEINQIHKHSVDTKIDELISDAKEIFNIIEEKKEYHTSIQSVLDKKINIELHKIENIDLFDGDIDLEKISIVNTISKLTKERREHKIEKSKLNNIKTKCEGIKDILDSIEIPIPHTETTYLSKEIIEDKILKEIKYANDKQRLNTMKQIEGKYDRVVNDCKNKKLICYKLANRRKA